MHKIARRHSSMWVGSLVLLALVWSAMPAKAEEQRVAALSRPVAAVPELTINTAPAAAEAKAVKPAAAKAAAKDIYERDLWRHQGAS